MLEDVVGADGKTVLVTEGTKAIGYLANLDEKEGSKGGKLSVEVSSLKAVDGTRIALRGIKTKNGAGGAGIGSILPEVCFSESSDWAQLPWREDRTTPKFRLER